MTPLTWRQWFDLRWLDLRYLLMDAYERPWWEFLVALGLLVLAAGTALWLVGCARVAWNGRPLAAIPLACAGSMLSLCAVVVPIAHAVHFRPRTRIVLGMPVVGPDLTWLPDDAVGWIPLGLALGAMGLLLAAIRGVGPSAATRG